MEKIVLRGKRIALRRPSEKPNFVPGQLSTELETEKAVGIIRYMGAKLNAGTDLKLGDKVYYAYSKGEQLRMKGEDLVIVNIEDIVARVEVIDGSA